MKNKEYNIAVNWSYIGISVVVLAILTVMVFYMPAMREIDTTILNSVKLTLSPYPSYIPLFVCEFGKAYGIFLSWPMVTAGCVLITHKLYLKAFMLILFTQLAYFLKDSMKDYVCRPRPDVCDVSGYSFPSGHAAVSVCFCGILIYLVHSYIKNTFWRNFLIILFGAWVLFVCVSRMWLGVHFLSDILAGLALGIILVNIYIILDKLFTK